MRKGIGAFLLVSGLLVTSEALVDGDHDTVNESLRWGTYNSGFYFGIRSRTESRHVSAGLLWSSSQEPMSKLRHQCLESDHLEKYGWSQHDGRHYGAQSIRDQHNNLELETIFLKPPTGINSFASGSWATRITTAPLSQELLASDISTSLFFYIDLGCEDDDLKHECREKLVQDLSWKVEGSRTCKQPVDAKSCVEMELVSNHVDPNLAFHARVQVHFTGDASHIDLRYHGAPSWSVVNIKQALNDYATSRLSEASHHEPTDVLLSNSIDPSSSLVLIQLRYVASHVNDVTLHLLYDEVDETKTSPVVVFDDVIPSLRDAFNTKFSQAFPMNDPAHTALGQAALSNLIGGIGYFYGSTILQAGNDAPKLTRPRSLYSAVPSRSFFPRGFLWDEGFHQLGIVGFDHEITVQVMDHWLDLMDEDGYISREQIRGVLAEARVPAEFITQYTTHANPPTLLLALEKLVPVVEKQVLQAWWPKIKLWLKWYQTTQEGPQPNTFRWRGRDINDGKLMPNTLSSGLDDYPRASHPSNDERHGSRILGEIATVLEDNDAAQAFNEQAEVYLDALDALHWDATDEMYYDYGLHSDDGEFEEHLVIRCQGAHGESIQTTANIEILRYNRDAGCPASHPHFLYPLGDGSGGLLSKQVFVPETEELQFVKRIGYVSFFPLFLQLLPPDSPKLSPLFHHVINHLLSPHGLVSISPIDIFFERPNAPGDAPYWRGPIWININYLALTSFHHYSKTATDPNVRKQSEEIYHILRNGLISSIQKEFETTGYLYEQYNPRTGRGQRSHPFTGWTALIVNILAQVY